MAERLLPYPKEETLDPEWGKALKEADDKQVNKIAHGFACGCAACKSEARDVAEYYDLPAPKNKWDAAQTVVNFKCK